MARKPKKIKRFSLSGKLDLPQDSFTECSLIEICGNGEVFISGCRSILEYSAEEVSFDTTLGNVSILGDCLKLCNFYDGRISVSGTVTEVKIDKRSKNEEGEK